VHIHMHNLCPVCVKHRRVLVLHGLLHLPMQWLTRLLSPVLVARLSLLVSEWVHTHIRHRYPCSPCNGADTV
jgi:hypothetical protein